MKDIYEVLQQKEADILVRKQIENLQIVSLLFCSQSNRKMRMNVCTTKKRS